MDSISELRGAVIFHSPRHFVVVSAKETYFVALPIVLHSPRAPTIVWQKHAIVHTSEKPPDPLEDDVSSEEERDFRGTSIRVDSDEPDEWLHPSSTINFSQTFSLEYNLPARSLGKVNEL